MTPPQRHSMPGARTRNVESPWRDAMTPNVRPFTHSAHCARTVRDKENHLPWQLYQAALQGDSHCFGAALATKFGENMADMGFDSVFRDM